MTFPFADCGKESIKFIKNNIAQLNNNSQAVSLLKFLEKGQHLELGSRSHLLRLCNGRTAEKEFLIGQLRDFIKFRLNGMTLLDNENVESIGSIARDFRNPGAHSEILTKLKAKECRRLCLGVLQRLEPCVAEARLANTWPNTYLISEEHLNWLEIRLVESFRRHQHRQHAFLVWSK